MKNLAGVESCDSQIKEELMEAGIGIKRNQNANGEVPYSITGYLGNITFKRAWTYWVVRCDLLRVVADKLYANPIGKKFIRVDGHCGCPAPEGERVTSYYVDTQEALNLFAQTIHDLFQGQKGGAMPIREGYPSDKEVAYQKGFDAGREDVFARLEKLVKKAEDFMSIMIRGDEYTLRMFLLDRGENILETIAHTLQEAVEKAEKEIKDGRYERPFRSVSVKFNGGTH